MKNLRLFICCMMLSMMAGAQPLHIFTYNLRYDTPDDGPNAWPERKAHLASQLRFHTADIVGIQEGLLHQLTDLTSLLPGFKFTGEGREVGKTGEHSAILYNTKRLTLMNGSTFWLSEHPNEIGAKGWDAACPRIITWAKFKDIATGKQFFVFNTHFDHIGEVARRNSALILLKAVDSISKGFQAIVTGDFNATPDDEPIKIITTASNKLLDTKTLSKEPHYGPSGTWNGFGPKEENDNPIDYIFLKKPAVVLQHATFSMSWNGRFTSDHFPVFASIEL